MCNTFAFAFYLRKVGLNHVIKYRVIISANITTHDLTTPIPMVVHITKL